MGIETVPLFGVVAMDVWEILWDILILLTMAVLLGTLAERLGQSVIVGYLIAGTLAGPNVLGWISTRAALLNIAELGIALLLFAIGLEFSPRRLLTLGKLTRGTGPLQVVITAIAASTVAFFFGSDGREALVVGLMVAMRCSLRGLGAAVAKGVPDDRFDRRAHAPAWRSRCDGGGLSRSNSWGTRQLRVDPDRRLRPGWTARCGRPDGFPSRANGGGRSQPQQH
ncbi:MAG: cation:proton antiporter [Pirellulales bacterium]